MNALLHDILVGFYGFFSTIPYLSFFEWTLHKYVMHKKVFGFFDYAFQAHAVVHHGDFKATESYHLDSHPESKDKVRMAWWNWILLIPLASALPIVFAYYFVSWPFAIGAIVATTLYYVAYEYWHYHMHVPRPNRFLVNKFKPFYYLNGHHLLHHLDPTKNLNVVCPLADLLCRTLMLRAPRPFPQARGPLVPDVQPLNIPPQK